MEEEIKIGPQSTFQEKYLNSDARILTVGGAAGSSKSYVGLMRHLRYAELEHYRGFCIRKNSTAIMKTGGLFDEAVHLYQQYDPKIKIKLKDQKIVFPSSGAEIAFSHYENDNASQLYQGLQLSNVFYDEATHADEKHIWWLISRLRTRAKMTPGIWLSCNPDPDSFLFDWVKWWLYPEGHEKYGLPDPDKNGLIRWIVRRSGVINWGDTREELLDRYGENCNPLSFQVLLGTIYDNPVLMKNQPEYLSNLEAMPDVERRRLLLGDWTAREMNSTHFMRHWVTEEVIEPAQADIAKTVRSYDFAGTLKSDSNPSPDYFATVKMSKLKDGSYFVHDVQRTRIRFGDWKAFIINNAMQDGPGVDIVLPEDPNPAAKAATKLLAKDIAEHGFFARTIRASSSKLDRFRPFSSLAMNGHIKFLKNCGTDHENKIYNDLGFVYKELETFTGQRKGGEAGHDDICDCLSDSTMILAQRTILPNFLSGMQSFGFDQKVNPLNAIR